MITPRFKCHQTDKSVVISVYCPSIRASDVEINVDDTCVTVHVNPYFLRLTFENSLTDDDDSSAQYDPSAGYLTVTLTKAHHGEQFRDLDLLAKLLAPKPTSGRIPDIQVISSVQNGDDLASKTEKMSLEHNEFLEAARNDWQLPQKISESQPSQELQTRYGFLDLYQGYFANVSYTENEINELGKDAEKCLVEERRSRRIAHENEKFDEEHYLADYADDEYIQQLLKWKHPYCSLTTDMKYTDQETLQILNLPQKEYLTTSLQTHNLYLVLVSLLFSYTYECRTTLHEATSESAWTLCSLTPAFSALDPPSYIPIHGQVFDFSEAELVATLVPSYRRSLAFPLYRSFALADTCRKDVSSLLQKGKRIVFRCLFEMKDILDHHDVYYVYSKIWLDDFCVWIQAYASDEILVKLSSQLAAIEIDKTSIGWELQALETAVQDHLSRKSDSDDESLDSE